MAMLLPGCGGQQPSSQDAVGGHPRETISPAVQLRSITVPRTQVSGRAACRSSDDRSRVQDASHFVPDGTAVRLTTGWLMAGAGHSVLRRCESG